MKLLMTKLGEGFLKVLLFGRKTTPSFCKFSKKDVEHIIRFGHVYQSFVRKYATKPSSSFSSSFTSSSLSSHCSTEQWPQAPVIGGSPSPPHPHSVYSRSNVPSPFRLIGGSLRGSREEKAGICCPRRPCNFLPLVVPLETMSTAPKRSHEDGSNSSSKHSHEDLLQYPRLMSAVTNEYHVSHESSVESRLPKIPRVEPRDPDRRSPLHTVFRPPLSSLDESNLDPALPSESRLESKDSRDGRDARSEYGDHRAENKESSTETRRESQNAKSERDGKPDSRNDDSRKMKCPRDSHSDMKVDTKVEKDGYVAGSSHLNWKESKEHYSGKRYSEAPTVGTDTWPTSYSSPQPQFESTKDESTSKERRYAEAHEAVGENKVDSKMDDRLKERDKKRKDAKYREWGERDKERIERRSSLPVISNNNDSRESTREERDGEKLDRDKNQPARDKEKLKEREKDLTKREASNGPEKEGTLSEKDSGDTHAKTSEQENALSELKLQRDFDTSKNAEKEGRDRKIERDTRIDGDRSDKRVKGNDKESDEGSVDFEGVERERELFSYDGVQQRKRMLRPRGSPQISRGDSRFKSRAQESEGLQGKPEVSSVIYKVGESMQELIKLWEEHESSQTQKDGETSNAGPTLEIRIPAEHVTATNRQVRGGQLWGTDTYTYDSDLVAVLMHTGYCRPTASPPPSAIQELRATIRVLPPLDCYISTLRNNVRSRAWGAAIGCSYRVERCCIVKKGGGTIDLEPCITHTSTVEPTIAPIAVERTMTTRAAASNALRQQRFVREVTIQYNLCNEPWIKYSLNIVADKGLKKPLYTSARLKKGEVLYLETHSCRYELCFSGEKTVKSLPASQMQKGEAEKPQNHQSHAMNGERNEGESTVVDVFRWSRCKKPLPQKVMRSIGVPLPLEHLEVLEENLDWEDVQWSQTGAWVAGKEYVFARVHFLSLN
ncbi:hypothetical protein MLD38_020450 [Melastoma candidum]|uniref:Uncharacterized protein n=1 Tax=Melastoma candidum TaxID=119954 RepID=A0ACB9QE68_9MYRT|nr:hypothetical protein MLD38_020450 [Melastoma candidum]